MVIDSQTTSTAGMVLLKAVTLLDTRKPMANENIQTLRLDALTGKGDKHVL